MEADTSVCAVVTVFVFLNDKKKAWLKKNVVNTTAAYDCSSAAAAAASFIIPPCAHLYTSQSKKQDVVDQLLW